MTRSEHTLPVYDQIYQQQIWDRYDRTTAAKLRDIHMRVVRERDELHRVLCEIADGHPTPRGYAEKTVGHREDRR